MSRKELFVQLPKEHVANHLLPYESSYTDSQEIVLTRPACGSRITLADHRLPAVGSAAPFSATEPEGTRITIVASGPYNLQSALGDVRRRVGQLFEA